jgi:RNA polymerase sigma-70 factor (subfamily 1)
MPEGNLRHLQTVDLVRAARDGRDAARDELFARYADRVLAIVRGRMGAKLRGAMESGDIAQDALLEALKSLDGFDMQDESSLIRWLAAIVQNRIGAAARDLGRERRSPDRAVPIEGLRGENSREIPLPASGSSPSLALRRREEKGLVDECLAALASDQREVILLRDYAGCSWDDIARETKAQSADAARMLHVRAVAKLGKLLRERGVGATEDSL